MRQFPSAKLKSQEKPRIAIFGCKWVAPESVYSLMNRPMPVELVLFGDDAEKLSQDVTELCRELPTDRHSTVRVGFVQDLPAATIAVISSTCLPTDGETEDEYLTRKIDLVNRDATALARASFNGTIIVTTSPIEITAQAAFNASGLTPSQVIGIGPQQASVFETAGSYKTTGNTWCTASCSYASYVDSCHPDCPYFEEMLSRFRTLRVDTPIGIETMASCVMRVCDAVLNDEKAVLPVAAMTNGQYGIMGVFATLPCVIGAKGVERILELPRSADEKHRMLDQARNVGRLSYRLFRRAAAANGGAH